VEGERDVVPRKKMLKILRLGGGVGGVGVGGGVKDSDNALMKGPEIERVREKKKRRILVRLGAHASQRGEEKIPIN